MDQGKGKLEIKHFTTPPNQKNEYLLINETEAAVIDVAAAYEEISGIIRDSDLRLKYILITHAHKTHIQALRRLKNNFGGAFCLHAHEYDLAKESDKELVPDRFVKDNTILKLGNTKIKVFHTPGHTKGSLSFYVKEGKALFSGATLLKGGYGQIWGPGSMSLMIFSLKRLSYNIPALTTIFTGSGELTTMAKESWIQCLRSA